MSYNSRNTYRAENKTKNASQSIKKHREEARQKKKRARLNYYGQQWTLKNDYTIGNSRSGSQFSKY